jgi:hypothetical protein
VSKKHVTELNKKYKYKRAIMYNGVRQFGSAKKYNDILDEIIKFVTV